MGDEDWLAELDRLREENTRLKVERHELIDALCALMVLPDGYCCCTIKQQMDGHTGECRDARAILEKLGKKVGEYPHNHKGCGISRCQECKAVLDQLFHG